VIIYVDEANLQQKSGTSKYIIAIILTEKTKKSEIYLSVLKQGEIG